LAKRTADVIARLTPLLGQFPKKRLEVKAVAFTGYAGPSAAIHSPGEIDFVMNVFWPAGGDEFAPDVVPREVAREWLPSGDGDLRKAWLTEGLLHYLAWRYLLEANPQASRVLVAESMRGVGTPVQLLRMEDTAGWRAHGKNVLDQENREREKREARKRGLLILRTLETVIDRERVDRVLPEIVRRSAHQSISLVDFERVCEEIAGRDLGWFFRYFFVDQGIPEIELHRLPAESPGVVAGEILVHGLPPEGSVRVEVAVHTAQGTVEHSVATRGEVTPFTVNVPAAATEIILDPDQRILRWTDAARKSQAQSQILAGLPKGITRKNVEEAIALYRRALQADPEDDSLRAQAFRERLGELEWAHNELDAALADLEAAIDGHSIAPFETYLTRGKACLYHGVVSLHEKRPKDALEDARAGLAMPLPVLQAILPREPIESHGEMALQQLLEILSDSARRY
jgi:tetratricopeptide (TPR) repeat protein